MNYFVSNHIRMKLELTVYAVSITKFSWVSVCESSLFCNYSLGIRPLRINALFLVTTLLLFFKYILTNLVTIVFRFMIFGSKIYCPPSLPKYQSTSITPLCHLWFNLCSLNPYSHFLLIDYVIKGPRICYLLFPFNCFLIFNSEPESDNYRMRMSI